MTKRSERFVNEPQLNNLVAIDTIKRTYPGLFVDSIADDGHDYTTLNRRNPLSQKIGAEIVLTENGLALWSVKEPLTAAHLDETISEIDRRAATYQKGTRWVGKNYIYVYPDIGTELKENVVFDLTLPQMVDKR